MRTQDQQQNGSSPQQPKPPKSLGKRLGLIFLYSFIICMSLSLISNKILHKELSVYIIVSIWAFTFFLMIYLFVKYVVNWNYFDQNTSTNAMYNSQQANYANYPQHNSQQERPVPLMLFSDILKAVGRYRSNQYAARQQQQQQQQQQAMANYLRCHPIRKKISTVFAILFILTMGLMGFQAYRLWCISQELNKNVGVEYRDYICVASTITNLSNEVIERSDEDGDYHDSVSIFDAVFTYGGTERTIHSSYSKYTGLSEGDIIYLYISPDDPDEIYNSFQLSDMVFECMATIEAITIVAILLIPRAF